MNRNRYRTLWNKQYYKKYPWKKVLIDIRQRCNNSKNKDYNNYGGRGIKCRITGASVKYLWYRDKAYLLKKPYIDRKDNDGNYELSNCQFIEKGKNSAERNTRVSSKPILQYDLNGKFIKRWNSINMAGKYLNVNPSQISNMLRGSQKTCKGFIWKYANS